jgi:hypothetical protein
VPFLPIAIPDKKTATPPIDFLPGNAIFIARKSRHLLMELKDID